MKTSFIDNLKQVDISREKFTEKLKTNQSG